MSDKKDLMRVGNSIGLIGFLSFIVQIIITFILAVIKCVDILLNRGILSGNRVFNLFGSEIYDFITSIPALFIITFGTNIVLMTVAYYLIKEKENAMVRRDIDITSIQYLSYKSVRGEANTKIFTKLFPAEKIGFKRFITAVFTIILAGVCGLVVTYFLNIILYFFGIEINSPSLGNPSGVIETVIFFIMISIIPSIFEEGLYRGYLTYMTAPYGVGVTSIISGLTFALVHGNLAQMPLAFFFGASAGYFMYIYKNIWIAVVAHFINNAFSSIMTIITDSTLSGGISYIYIGGILMAGAASLATLSMNFDKDSVKLKKEDVGNMFRIILSPAYIVFVVVSIIFTVINL